MAAAPPKGPKRTDAPRTAKPGPQVFPEGSVSRGAPYTPSPQGWTTISRMSNYAWGMTGLAILGALGISYVIKGFRGEPKAIEAEHTQQREARRPVQ